MTDRWEGADSRNGRYGRLHSIPSSQLGPLAPWLLLSVLLVWGVLLGGGGSKAALPNLLVQLLALLIFALHPDCVGEFFRKAPRGLIILSVASLMLPVLQVIPLPPEIWHTFPGRELVIESLGLLGKEWAWFPISVDSGRTLIAAMSLVPPLSILMVSTSLGNEGARNAAMILVALGLVNVILGGVHLTTGYTSASFYPGGDANTLFGTFANRNTTAIFLDVTIVVALTIYWPKKWGVLRHLGPAVSVPLVIGVLVTHSRSGAALMVVGLLGSAAICLFDRRRQGVDTVILSRGKVVALMLIPMICIIAMMASSPRIMMTVSRFVDEGDNRSMIWKDAVRVAERYFPLGSGIGTFEEVFQVDESLEVLDPFFAGRAHSDWIELFIDAGVVGGVLALSWVIYFVHKAWTCRRFEDRRLRLGAGLGLLMILLQSGLDYPLRNQALLCVVGLLVWLLCRPWSAETIFDRRLWAVVHESRNDPAAIK